MSVNKKIKSINKKVKKGATAGLDEIKKSITYIINKFKYIDKLSKKIYKYVKEKFIILVVIGLTYLFFPHIMALLNFSTNIMILSRINSSKEGC